MIKTFIQFLILIRILYFFLTINRLTNCCFYFLHIEYYIIRSTSMFCLFIFPFAKVVWKVCVKLISLGKIQTMLQSAQFIHLSLTLNVKSLYRKGVYVIIMINISLYFKYVNVSCQRKGTNLAITYTIL